MKRLPLIWSSLLLLSISLTTIRLLPGGFAPSFALIAGLQLCGAVGGYLILSYRASERRVQSNQGPTDLDILVTLLLVGNTLSLSIIWLLSSTHPHQAVLWVPLFIVSGMVAATLLPISLDRRTVNHRITANTYRRLDALWALLFLAGSILAGLALIIPQIPLLIIVSCITLLAAGTIGSYIALTLKAKRVRAATHTTRLGSLRLVSMGAIFASQLSIAYFTITRGEAQAWWEISYLVTSVVAAVLLGVQFMSGRECDDAGETIHPSGRRKQQQPKSD